MNPDYHYNHDTGLWYIREDDYLWPIPHFLVPEEVKRAKGAAQ